jgi:glycosyltransferase involved in cell wall biosynthesis
MKILAISYMLPPMLFPQAIQIGRLLYHSKHQIMVVSGLEVSNGQTADDYPDFDLRVKRLAIPFRQRLSGSLHLTGMRFLPFYGALPDIYRPWIMAAHDAVMPALGGGKFKPDLLVTFGEPMSDHLLGLRLKKELDIPWLAHFSDPWADNPFRRLQPLSMRLNRRLEKQVVATADACAFTSEETVGLVLKKYGSQHRKRAFVLPHAYDPAFYREDATRTDSDKIVLRYIGNFYGFRSPRPLIRALAWIAGTEPSVLENVKVELVGSIPPRMLLSPALRLLPPGLLVARGSVPYRESIRLMQTADVLLTIDAPAKHSVFFPSKLADYIGAGRRLLGIVPAGAARRIIESCGGAAIAPDASVEALATFLIREIAEARAQKAAATAPAVPKEIAAHYAIANVSAMFDDICRTVATSATRPRDVAA